MDVFFGRTAVLEREVPAKTGTNSKYKQIDNVKSYKKSIIFCKKSKFMLLYRRIKTSCFCGGNPRINFLCRVDRGKENIWK